MPCSSQAAMVSSSRFEPPGWMIAVMPAAGGDVGAVAEREEGVGGQHGPAGPVAGLLDGDPDRVQPAHLAGADAQELAVLGHHDRVRLDHRRRPARRTRGRARSASVGARPVATWPGGRVGLELVPVLGEQPALDPPQVEARGRRVGRADRALPGRSAGRCSSRSASSSSHRERLGLEAGREDRLEEPAGLAHPLGRRPVDRPVQADDPAEGADRVALVGALERLARSPADRGAAGVVVLEDARGRLGEHPDQPQGAVEVEQVVVRQLLAVQDLGGRQVAALGVRARRRRPPAGAGSRRSAESGRSVKVEARGVAGNVRRLDRGSAS